MINLAKKFNLDDSITASIFTERGGWWGDAGYGSEIFRLKSGKLDNQALLLATQYIRTALDWLLTDNIATAIDVETKFYNYSGISATVNIVLNKDHEILERKYFLRWGFE